MSCGRSVEGSSVRKLAEVNETEHVFFTFHVLNLDTV